jgi:hypothetical protein
MRNKQRSSTVFIEQTGTLLIKEINNLPKFMQQNSSWDVQHSTAQRPPEICV